MARARNIKPAFFTSEQVADNCPLGRLLFVGLWTESDYQGNIEWKPRTLKVKLLPFDNCDIEQLAINLDKSGLIRFYSVAGQLFVNIPNFDRHQNPHKNERDKGTDIPAYSEEARQVVDLKGLAINLDKNGTNPDQNGSDRADSLLLIPDSLSLIPDSNAPDSGKKQAQEKPARFDPLDVDLPEGIKPSAWEAWIAYRRAMKLKVLEPTIQAQLKKLSEWWNKGHDPNAIIEESISNGWKGLFEPKGVVPANQVKPTMTNAEIAKLAMSRMREMQDDRE